MDYQNWRVNEDELVLDRLSIFEYGKPCTMQEVETDYIVQTERGSFYQVKRPNENMYDLFFYDGIEETKVLSEIYVLATNKKQKFLMIYEKMLGYIYVIDTRGILFLYTSINEELDFTPGEFKLVYNKENCCYDIDAKELGIWRIKVTERNINMPEYLGDDKDDELEINPEFKEFFDKEDEKPYLYLTYKGLKMKKIISYFIEHELEHEIVPNMYKDDNLSTNIRILIDEKSVEKQEVQYLIARFDNCYSIYDMPYELFIGNMDIDENQRKMFKSLHITSKGSEKQSKKIKEIIKATKVKTDCRVDSILFNEYFKIIAVKMEKSVKKLYDNQYLKKIIPYPSSYLGKEENKRLLLSYVDYLRELKLPYNEEGIEGMNEKEAYKACVNAHNVSMKNFKKEVRDYEEGIVVNKRLYGKTNIKTREGAIWNFLFFGQDIK